MTPDEQPQPVASDPVVARYLAGSNDDLVDVCMQVYARSCMYNTESQHNAAMAYCRELKRRLAHPPTSAASLDAVRVTEKQINDMTIVLMDNWYMDRHSWRAGSGANERIERMRSALVKAIQAVLNPPAESAARGDVPNATPTSGGGS